jgi:DNA-binding response OmpR family regulator
MEQRPELHRGRDLRTSQGRILFVAEDGDARDSLADTLERAGFDVSFARSSAAALALTAVDTPDLVLFDAALLEPSGAEVLSRMTASPRMKSVHLFVMLPPGLEPSHAAALRSAADVCFPRHVDPRILKARIGLALRTRRRAQQPRRSRSLRPFRLSAFFPSSSSRPSGPPRPSVAPRPSAAPPA